MKLAIVLALATLSSATPIIEEYPEEPTTTIYALAACTADPPSAATSTTTPSLLEPPFGSLSQPTSEDSSGFQYLVSLPFPKDYPLTAAYGIRLQSNGDVIWLTVFNHVSGADYQDYGIACAVQDLSGNVYTFSNSGFVGPFGDPASNDVQNVRGNFGVVHTNWADIVGGRRAMSCSFKAASSLSAETLEFIFNEAVRGSLGGSEGLGEIYRLFA